MTPQRIFDTTRSCLVAFHCRMAGRQTAFRNTQLGKNRDDAGTPIQSARSTIGPVRQLDLFDLFSRPGDGTGEPGQQHTGIAVRQSKVYCRSRPSGIEGQ
jgi:hypothetical protein